MLIEFGNVMNLELNFTAQNLAKAIKDHKIIGVYETSPCFASMIVHYEPEEIKFHELKKELFNLIESLGPTDDIEINSRVFSFPTVYLLSLIHISEPTRRTPISYAVFCL